MQSDSEYKLWQLYYRNFVEGKTAYPTFSEFKRVRNMIVASLALECNQEKLELAA